MEDRLKRKNIQKRKSRIRRNKVRRTIIFIVCTTFIITSATIFIKNIHSNNTEKNKGIQVSEGVYDNENKSTKSDNNVVKASAVASSNKKVSSNNNIESNSEAVNAEEAFVKDGKKTAYLTFDDGPSVTVTPKILDVLKQYKVNATFFVLGSNIESNEESKEILKRTFQEGHTLGNHSYTHSLKKLYPNNRLNIDYFMEELDKTNNALKSVLGQDFNTRVIRMPGGYLSRKYYKDPNLPAFDDKLKERNMLSIDWNAYDADAEGRRKNAQQLLEEVKKTVGTQEKVVILMHDTYGKEETAKALPQIIEYLKGQGYEFKILK